MARRGVMERLDGRVGVSMLVAGIALVTAALYVTTLADMPAPAGHVHVPWWVVALVFFAVEARVVHLHFRSEAHSLSLSELGLVLGLFFLTPGGILLAQLTGASVALVACRRQRPLKAAFNLAQF